jgi:hyaluronan synthase
VSEQTAVEIVEKRRYSREKYPSEAVIAVGRWPRNRSMPVRIVDVSAAGASVELSGDESLSADQSVVITWKVPPTLGLSSQSETRAMEGTLVWQQADLATSRCGIRFDRPIDEEIESNNVRLQRMLIAAVAFGLAVMIAILKVRNVLSFWYEPFFQTYSILAGAFVLSRFAISMFYREPADHGYLPTISVIIAAKNEEKHIAETIHCVFQSRYPRDRMEVLAIDDGSDDGTWPTMQQMTEQYPQLRVFRFEKNQGKRHAMGLGAKQSKGDVLVYVDSDSYVEPQGIYKIVQPFFDETVGAVSGHVLAAIEEDNFISKMESVRYYISHRIMKAAEGVFGAVTCCPGAFSAYRRAAIMEILDEWLDQKFMGTQATFGDDRSLTNYILKKYQVLYHAGAKALTYVPDRWSKFFRQQLRWKKSWTRETTVAVRILYKKHPIAAISYYVGVILTFLSPLIAIRALLVLPIFFGATTWIPYVGGLLLVYTFLCLLCYYFTRSRYWYYGLAFAALYITVLSFQNYYALVTVNKNHWGTR